MACESNTDYYIFQDQLAIDEKEALCNTLNALLGVYSKAHTNRQQHRKADHEQSTGANELSTYEILKASSVV